MAIRTVAGQVTRYRSMKNNIWRILPMSNYDVELDARGLNCPLPILRAKKSLTDLSSGQVLRILATDPGSVKDFEAFCKQTGNELENSEESGQEFVFHIRKG